MFRLPRIAQSTGRAQPTDRPAAAPSQWINALHVFVLASFVVTQPLYDRLGDRPAYLVDQGIRPPVLFLVMAVMSLGLPAAIAGIEWLAWRWSRRAGNSVHAIMIYLFMLLLVLPVMKHVSFLSGAMVVGGALIVAAAGAWCYFEISGVRTLMTHCAAAIIVFPVVFLFSPAAKSILFPPQSPRPGRWNPVPTVVLVFDELCGASLLNGDREIDADRFPNLARLSRQTSWFRNARAVHSHTEQAVPALLSGKYPTTSWPPVTADLPQNLFSVLDLAGGYELAVFEPATNLAPMHRVPTDFNGPGAWQQTGTLLASLARVYLFHVAPHEYYIRLPPIPDLWWGLRDSHHVDRTMRRGVFRYNWTETRNQQFDHFLTTLGETSQPTLYFMHLLLPHVPWSYLPTGRRYTEAFDTLDLMNFNAHCELLNFWGQDEWLVIQSQQRYLLQLAYLDRLIGRLLERLNETGLYDRCLLIVTADHGVAFRAKLPRRQTAGENLGDIASIPLFIKRPFQSQGEIIDRAVESVDIFPTIADELGIELSDPIDGWSVFDKSRPERATTTIFQDRSSMPVEQSAVAASDVPQIIRKRFGAADDPAALFRVGPIPELIDRPTDSLVQSGDPPVEIELIRYGDVASDDVDDVLPCFFEGRIWTPARVDAGADRPTVLAVSINGTIRAVTRTYQLDGFRDRWAALVPESSFHPGKNDVQFFVVTGTQPDWRLSRCTSQSREK